jgi:hypothetical protein
LSLPLSARYGNVAETATIVRCSNDQQLIVRRYYYSNDGTTLWLIDPLLNCKTATAFLYDLAAKRINRHPDLRSYLGTSRRHVISGEETRKSRQIMMFAGRGPVLPSEELPLVAYFRLWFAEDSHLGRTPFFLGPNDLPYVRSVQTIPWSQITEAV